MLATKFAARLAEARSTATNAHLIFLSDSVKAVEEASRDNAALQDFVSQLDKMLNEPNFALVPKLTNDFAQTLGEAHFWSLCKDRGVELKRVPEQPQHSVKTPDFESIGLSPKLYFEVKTLSVVGGDFGIAKMLDGAVDANIAVEAQINAGARIAMAEQCVTPYGDKPYAGNGALTAVISTLVDKARQNLKKDQFKHPNTFLVVNLSIIGPFEATTAALRPSYPSKNLYIASVTGELWMAAFGKPGMLIQTMPEFEGKPAIEGVLPTTGILSDPTNDFVDGILFIIHPWSKPAEMWGLFRSVDIEGWDDQGPHSGTDEGGVAATLRRLLGHRWNDCRDTNGWALTENSTL